MLRPGVTVVIPSIPRRRKALERAIGSVLRQTVPFSAISVVVDHEFRGAGPTRTEAMMAVRTEWLSFLDDDDHLKPHYLETLQKLQADTGADVVSGWWDGSNDVWGDECVRGMCPNCHRHWTPMPLDSPHLKGQTFMVRTELAQAIEFPPAQEGPCGNEDWIYVLKLCELLKEQGGSWHHTPEALWTYGVGDNTSGQPWRAA